jgi:hypothetical protein
MTKLMAKTVLVGIAVALVAFVAAVALQPDRFTVTRSATIAAPPPVVFAQVNDLHAFQTWNPFAKHDPAIKTTYQGPQAGTGASLAWAGNSEVGEGSMTIVESRPSDVVRLRLDFLKPFKATNAAEFTFRPEGGRTAVTWSMTGENNFVTKAVQLFMDMDTMVGGEFEKGLAEMKTIAEASAS